MSEGDCKEREREREKDEMSMRIGRERESPGKTDVPKLYAYNECEHSVYPLLIDYHKTNQHSSSIDYTKKIYIHLF